jgi:hypothetical protein
VGCTYKARASEMRMRHPPEKLLVTRFCIFSEKPRPCRILDARDSAVDAPSSFMRS